MKSTVTKSQIDFENNSEQRYRCLQMNSSYNHGPRGQQNSCHLGINRHYCVIEVVVEDYFNAVGLVLLTENRLKWKK